MTTEPGISPCSARCAAGRMSIRAAPAHNSANAWPGVTRSIRLRADARISSIERAPAGLPFTSRPPPSVPATARPPDVHVVPGHL